MGVVLASSFFAFQIAVGGILHVDNRTGDDQTGDGSAESPFASIQRAVNDLKPGGTIEVAKASGPYLENVDVRNVRSTEDKPASLNGNGAVLSGMSEREPDQWKAEGNDVFSTPLPNNAWGMEKHWEGGFALVQIDGREATNVSSKEELTPGSYFLYKNRAGAKEDPLHNTLFVQLEPGKTPSDVSLKAVSSESRLSLVGCENFIVRDLIAEFCGRDGFSTTQGSGLVLERIEGRFNMDQGISHHGSNSTVRHSWFHGNAGAGIVDVYEEAVVRYEFCLIENDSWRGGVELHRGSYEMDSCVIAGNPNKALLATKEATVKLQNCLFIGVPGQKTDGVLCTGGAKVEMDSCTLIDFATALSARNVGTHLFISNTAVLRSPQVWVVKIADMTDGPDPFSGENNLYQNGNLLFEFTNSKVENPDRRGNHAFDESTWQEFVTWSKSENRSAMIPGPLAKNWQELFSLKTPAGIDVGARLDESVRVGPEGAGTTLVPTFPAPATAD